jgi:TonB family protein
MGTMQPVQHIKPPALALLTYKVDPRPYGVSLAIQASLVAIFSVMLAVQVPEVQKVVTDHYLVMPLTPYVPDKLQVTKIRTVKVALPEPPVVAKLVVPREISRRPVFEVKDVSAPKVEATKFDLKVPTVRTPEKPKVVVVGGFEGSNAKPTLKESPKNVQTGGFGDPNGIAGKSDRDAKLVAVHRGQFELPGGPGIGNGQGGARGVQGTVASAGFGNGIATSSPGGSNRGGVRTGGFGDAATGSTGGGGAARQSAASPTTPVEILAKPNPVYTAEARQKRIEGEVLLEVDFGANGQLQVRRVVRGLGYGLDDAAVHAAERIRYKPAQQDGRPTDTIATLHILFQLAE